MTSQLTLDGDGWQLRGCLGDSWRWYVGPDRAWDGAGWHPARVPGSVIDDLWRAGQVANPYFERNSLLLEWASVRYWVYRRWLQTPALAEGQRGTLVFEGVDYQATILVDGEVMGEHEGVFVPFEIDVTGPLSPGGRHLLAVVIHPAPPSEPQMGDTARVRVHKARMSYGHDFCPRLVHVGIWQGVTLHLGATPFRPRPIVHLVGSEGKALVDGAQRLSLLDNGAVVAQADGPELAVYRPRLWWPNGSGEAHCYVLRAERGDQSRELQVGFRHLEWAANPGGPPGARAYTAVVNGKAMFLKGWNWAPIDALYGVPQPRKLAHLLALARDAGANCLRAWGGGLLETKEFYDLCDRWGLLVWQEFSLSSSGEGSVPSADPRYLAAMAGEAPVVIAERRHHPSLALWCGGNELAYRVPGRDDRPIDESVPVIGLLAGAVEDHDRGRLFLPTSPSGPRFLNRLDLIGEDPDGQHDVHGPWEHQGLGDHNVLYDAGTCLLHSEVGVEGMTNRAALEQLIGPERRWPADRSNDVYEHLGAWWNNAPLVQRCFGGRLDRLDLLRRASQHLQYDGLRYAVESRLRHAPRTSGVFPWQFNESYPNAWCTAAVDHGGHPKPAYYGVARAYRPNHVCAAFPTWAWATSGTDDIVAQVWAWPGPAIVTARVVDVEGDVVAEESYELARQGDSGALHVPKVRISTPIFLLDLVAATAEGSMSRNRYLMSLDADLSGLLDLAPAQVHAGFDARGELYLSHGGGPAALGIVIEDGRAPGQAGWPVLGDNVIDLLPGEAKAVALGWRHAPVEGRSLRLEGWNVHARTLFPGR